MGNKISMSLDEIEKVLDLELEIEETLDHIKSMYANRSENNWELEVINKIENKVALEEDDLFELFTEYEVDRTDYKGDYGWTVDIVMEIQGRLFMMECFEPYDDNGDYEFDNQPFEVEMYEEEVIVKKYKKK